MATDYYFAQAGDDDTGSGTILAPYKSIAKANSLSYSVGDRILFNRGDSWTRGAGALQTLNIPANVAGVGAYGSGNRPVIDNRQLAGTFADQGGNVWAVGDATLCGLWRMESPGNGLTASFLDDSGLGNHLTPSGTTFSTAQVQEGDYSALLVAASSHNLTRTDASLSTGFPAKNGGSTTVVTFGAWVYANSFAGSGLNVILSKKDSFYLTYHATSGLWRAHTAAGARPSNSAAASGQWVHLVGRANTGTGIIDLWVNGVKQTASMIGTLTTIPGVVDVLGVGVYPSPAYNWDGYIDEAFVYAAALSDAAIESIYTNGVAPSPVRSQPAYVFVNGTLGTQVANVGALAQAGDWTWAAGVLSVYATSDPSAATTVVISEDPTQFRQVSEKTYASLFGGDRSGVAVDDLDFIGGTHPIAWLATAGNIAAGPQIRGCRVRYAAGYGVQCHGNSRTITGPLCSSLEVSDVGAAGIIFRYGVTSGTVSGCQVTRAGSLPVTGVQGWHGISQYGSAGYHPTGCQITGNTVIETFGNATGGFVEGAGIQCDDEVASSVVSDNVVRDNGGPGLMDNSNPGNLFARNLSTGNRYGIDLNATASTAYHNTFYDNTEWGIIAGGTGGTLKDNICAENVGEVNAKTGYVLDYNCVYHSGGGTFMTWNSVAYNWANWKTNSGQDANSLNTDPLFLNAAGGDFHLQSASPCKYTGVYIAGVSTRDPPSMGAFEFGATVLRPWRTTRPWRPWR